MERDEQRIHETVRRHLSTALRSAAADEKDRHIRESLQLLERYRAGDD